MSSIRLTIPRRFSRVICYNVHLLVVFCFELIPFLFHFPLCRFLHLSKFLCVFVLLITVSIVAHSQQLLPSFSVYFCQPFFSLSFSICLCLLPLIFCLYFSSLFVCLSFNTSLQIGFSFFLRFILRHVSILLKDIIIVSGWQ